MGTREIKVCAIQMKTLPGTSKEEKVEYVLPLIEKAAKEGCKIIMPPELCTSDYEKFYVKDPALFEEAEPIPGPTTDAVGQVAKKYGVYVVFPMFEQKAPGIYYNAAALIGPDGTVVGNYRKTHVAGVQVLEKLYFRNGQKFEVWETAFEPFAKAGTIICHDRRYPETSRILAMMGAEIMFCPTAAPGYAGGVHWDVVNVARSVDTGMFTIYSNKIGMEWEKNYFGASMIVNPFGEVIAHGGTEVDAIVSATLDLDQVDQARIAVPTLRDIRNDFYMKYYSDPKYDQLLG
jgi:N-carbamoylputrescine amidase